MKTRALYKIGKNEFQRITAKEAIENKARQPYIWEGREYYPYRKECMPMYAKTSIKGRHFFAFKSDADEEVYLATGGGESKTHNLVKLALTEMESTTLKVKGLFQNGDIHEEKIFFSDMRDEVHVQSDGKDYFIDVAGRFKSGGLLEEKWDGRIGIEVHHQHKVGKIKKDALINKKAPVVEFDIPDIKPYWGPEDYLDERQENRYIAYVKKALSNYMWVTVISNPSSNAYLSRVNRSLWEEKRALVEKLNSTKVDYEEVQTECERLRGQTHRLRQEIERLTANNDSQFDTIVDLEAQLSNIRSTGAIRLVFLKLLGRL
jgi:hypothetical protein